MRIAAITANFGNFDTVKELPPQSIKYDRFYYTEKNSPFPFHTIDDRLKAKYFKICMHKVRELSSYDVFIWIDGNVQVKAWDFIETLTMNLVTSDNLDFCISRHPARKSIYEEADFIIKEIRKGNNYLSQRYSVESLQKEMNFIGMDRRGLYWCGLFARRNRPILNNACEEWWERNILYSNFDQLNFVDIVHKHRLILSKFHFTDFYDNKYYKLIKHNK